MRKPFFIWTLTLCITAVREENTCYCFFFCFFFYPSWSFKLIFIPYTSSKLGILSWKVYLNNNKSMIHLWETPLSSSFLLCSPSAITADSFFNVINADLTSCHQTYQYISTDNRLSCCVCTWLPLASFSLFSLENCVVLLFGVLSLMWLATLATNALLTSHSGSWNTRK